MRAMVADNGQVHGVLVHVIFDGAEQSLCGVFARDHLVPGVSGEQICPACLEHLRTEWQTARSFPQSTWRHDAFGGCLDSKRGQCGQAFGVRIDREWRPRHNFLTAVGEAGRRFLGFSSWYGQERASFAMSATPHDS